MINWSDCVVSEEKQRKILAEVGRLVGFGTPPPELLSKVWLELRSGVWLVSPMLYKWLTNTPTSLDEPVVAGVFLGTQRRVFALALEVLPLLKEVVGRKIVLGKKPLKSFLYGRTLALPSAPPMDWEDEPRVVVTDTQGNPVGVGQVGRPKDGRQVAGQSGLVIRPLVDLGIYIRKEREAFA